MRLRVLAAVIILAGAAVAQTFTGTITGLVTDASGAAVPGAEILVVNTDTGLRTSVATDARGNYAATQLPRGNYRAEAVAKGF